MTTEIIEETEINNIYDNIKKLVINARNKVYTTVNIEMLNLYWNIGKGFSSRNLRTMRKFYLTYPIWKTVSAKLSWSHYLELIDTVEEEKI